ncbi:hypothetical protein BDY21DRAFT_402847 [Lineolata rhizophorae]|uniref:non-specific serine/threonine protein kinase n=1 Tax=Lineolata rhizophorae TaxID=578093 RepID=A0A6A6PAD9_9PEZI|nr:hypothetical protein BDY21DRAFT_402847 [Lineolata rhizophorae]
MAAEQAVAAGQHGGAARGGAAAAHHGHPQQAPPGSSHSRGGSGAAAQPAGSGSAPRRRQTIKTPTGEWSLGKTIGAGSMGKVKVAKNLETGEQVAVKIVPRHSTDEHRTPEERQRADHSKEIRTAREAAIVSLVNHPYICGMRDFVKTNYHWYMLFEYVNGGQMLDYIISHGRLKEKQARKFARQIASALDYCHRNSIVHRDLKIENILISKTGDIKIIDFGLSNLFSPHAQLGTFCGSLYFAAPELLQAQKYTGPEVDVWSFGIVLYVLVCGKVPFDDQDMPKLHAKIKKGNVEYPPWLSSECKNLIGRMLVTNPRERGSLAEIMNHPWMTKGFNTPPENYLPYREPLQLPLDTVVIERMTGFDFGSTEYITNSLTKILESDDYQHALRLALRRQQQQQQSLQTPETERKRGVFDFYKRRNSTTSRDTLLTNPSAEAVAVGADPVNAFHPLISVYFLVREKLERERVEANPGALGMQPTPGDPTLKLPDLPSPEAAYTNPATYEMAGEKPTGGRTRPRARTHGEDEVTEGLQKVNIGTAAVQHHQPGPASPAALSPGAAGEQQHPHGKKESTAAGLLRRFSTRRHRGDMERDRDRERDHRGEHWREKQPPVPPTPSLTVNSPTEPASMRKSFSVRRKDRDQHPPPPALLNAGANVPQTPTHGHAHSVPQPPHTALKALGRSTSVNSADLRRRLSRRGASDVPVGGAKGASDDPRAAAAAGHVTDRSPRGADEDGLGTGMHGRPHTAAAAGRAKSLGHARRESIQARRAKRAEEQQRSAAAAAAAAAAAEGGGSTIPRRSRHHAAAMKPVYLKGLFSVSTTSNKPLPVIRADIIRVLDMLGVKWHEIRGGFSCKHHQGGGASSGSPGLRSPSPGAGPPGAGGIGHRRKISFGGFMAGERDRDRDDFAKDKGSRRHHRPDDAAGGSKENAAASPPRTGSHAGGGRKGGGGGAAGAPRERPAGETSTHVQADMGRSTVLRFEIFVVKVPLLSLHGIQFKKVDGGTWQYKSLAQRILDELRL